MPATDSCGLTPHACVCCSPAVLLPCSYFTVLLPTRALPLLSRACAGARADHRDADYVDRAVAYAALHPLCSTALTLDYLHQPINTLSLSLIVRYMYRPRVCTTNAPGVWGMCADGETRDGDLLTFTHTGSLDPAMCMRAFSKKEYIYTNIAILYAPA